MDPCFCNYSNVISDFNTIKRITWNSFLSGDNFELLALSRIFKLRKKNHACLCLTLKIFLYYLLNFLGDPSVNLMKPSYLLKPGEVICLSGLLNKTLFLLIIRFISILSTLFPHRLFSVLYMFVMYFIDLIIWGFILRSPNDPYESHFISRRCANNYI